MCFMITTILSKYDGYRNYWFPEVTDINLYINSEIKAKYSEGCFEEERKLLSKWREYVPIGWYGMSFGEPFHHLWYLIIDEFLEYLVSFQKNSKIEGFEIHQIKLKMGGIRFRISYICHDEELREFITLQISKLESTLFDSKLIY